MKQLVLFVLAFTGLSSLQAQSAAWPQRHLRWDLTKAFQREMRVEYGYQINPRFQWVTGLSLRGEGAYSPVDSTTEYLETVLTVQKAEGTVVVAQDFAGGQPIADPYAGFRARWNWQATGGARFYFLRSKTARLWAQSTLQINYHRGTAIHDQMEALSRRPLLLCLTGEDRTLRGTETRWRQVRTYTADGRWSAGGEALVGLNVLLGPRFYLELGTGLRTYFLQPNKVPSLRPVAWMGRAGVGFRW